MLLKTRDFGDREIDETKIIIFEDGIPGFKDCTRFIIFTEDDQNINTIWWLQSIDYEDLAFPVLNTFAVVEDYNPEIEDSLLEILGEFEIDDLVVCNILVVPEDITQMTVNLKAPVIINAKTKKGIQVIVNNNEYEIRHSIYSQIKTYEEEVGE